MVRSHDILARIWRKLAKSASFFVNPICLVARAILVFAKQVGFVTKELFILAKPNYFVASCDTRWPWSCLLTNSGDVVVRYSRETKVL